MESDAVNLVQLVTGWTRVPCTLVGRAWMGARGCDGLLVMGVDGCLVWQRILRARKMAWEGAPFLLQTGQMWAGSQS